MPYKTLKNNVKEIIDNIKTWMHRKTDNIINMIAIIYLW